jgi:CcmD family protein
MKQAFIRALFASALLGLLLLEASPVEAQDETAQPAATEQTEETAAEERAAQFVGVTGPEAESVPGGPLLLAAYAVVWVLLFLFLFRMRGLQRQTATELERLAAEVRATEGG